MQLLEFDDSDQLSTKIYDKRDDQYLYLSHRQDLRFDPHMSYFFLCWIFKVI